MQQSVYVLVCICEAHTAERVAILKNIAQKLSMRAAEKNRYKQKESTSD
jgi:hypothetical protein